MILNYALCKCFVLTFQFNRADQFEMCFNWIGLYQSLYCHSLTGWALKQGLRFEERAAGGVVLAGEEEDETRTELWDPSHISHCWDLQNWHLVSWVCREGRFTNLGKDDSTPVRQTLLWTSCAQQRERKSLLVTAMSIWGYAPALNLQVSFPTVPTCEPRKIRFPRLVLVFWVLLLPTHFTECCTTDPDSVRSLPCAVLSQQQTSWNNNWKLL